MLSRWNLIPRLLHSRKSQSTHQQLARTRWPQRRPLGCELLEDRRLLAIFTVENLADSGPGSLRQAILDANVATGADQIFVEAGLTGTISLMSGQMTITDSVTINGTGAENLTINANQMSRIFQIASSNDIAVEISALQLTEAAM